MHASQVEQHWTRFTEWNTDLFSFLSCRGVSLSTSSLLSPVSLSLTCQDHAENHSNPIHQIFPGFNASISKCTMKANGKSNLINRINFWTASLKNPLEIEVTGVSNRTRRNHLIKTPLFLKADYLYVLVALSIKTWPSGNSSVGHNPS